MRRWEKKIWPVYFNLQESGAKQFELRKDEGYEIGDLLLLAEWNPETKRYTGRTLFRTITYVLRHAAGFGLAPDHAILGTREWLPEPAAAEGVA